MQIGDKVQVLGTVRDIVDQSTLLVTDDGREYWILSQHVSLQPEAAAQAAAKTPATTPAATSASEEEAPDLESMTKEELVTYAHKTLNLKLDARKPKDELIEEIEEKRAEVGAG